MKKSASQTMIKPATSTSCPRGQPANIVRRAIKHNNYVENQRYSCKKPINLVEV